MPRKELIENLTLALECSKRTVVTRLKQISEKEIPVSVQSANYQLCTRLENKELIYYLNPLKSMLNT